MPLPEWMEVPLKVLNVLIEGGEKVSDFQASFWTGYFERNDSPGAATKQINAIAAYQRLAYLAIPLLKKKAGHDILKKLQLPERYEELDIEQVPAYFSTLSDAVYEYEVIKVSFINTILKQSQEQASQVYARRDED